MKDDRLYLSNIKESIERIESYTCDGKEVFLQTLMIPDTVIRNFEIIGEATKRLSTDLREAYPNVPWQQIAGFRDVLIHDYLKVNLNRVWGVIEQNLPELKATVEEMLQKREEEGT
ncbi:MAG: HepT-like ribonuclease domain-containing protein [Brasilonema sp.]